MLRSLAARGGAALALAAAALAQPPVPPRPPDEAPGADRAQLAERAKSVRADAKAYAAAEAKAAADRAATLQTLGITGVTPLDPLHDPARSVDIVIIGDGFTAAEQDEWKQVAARIRSNFNTRPYDTHAGHTNFYRVDLVSPQSGCDHDGTEVDTLLDGCIQPAGAGKMLRVDVGKTAQRCRAAVPRLDYILVVLNTHGKFLGSANTGKIVRLSTAKGHQRSIVMHEFGHNFGPILDEYVDGKQGGNRTPSPRIEGSVNATLEPNIYLARWHHWNVPEDVFRGTTKKRGKHFAFLDVVRSYEGAATYFNDVYRAEENCHMQRGRGKQYCRVCTEGIEVRLLRFFPPITRVAPMPAMQRIGLNQQLWLEVEPISQHADDPVVVRFWRDGTMLAARKVKEVTPKRGAPGGRRWQLKLTGKELGEGTHHITATVDLLTPRVHMDEGRLGGAFAWTVEVTKRGPLLKAPKQITGTVGQEIAVVVEPHPDGAPGAWACANPPAGAAVTTAGAVQTLRFTPDRRGRYRLEYRQGQGRFTATRSVDVTVSDDAKRGNQKPVFCFLPPRTVTAGAPVAFRLEAYDADDDHLAFSADGLPAGAALHPDTGALTWTPGHTQMGTYTVDVAVTDGTATAKSAVTITVEGSPMFRGVFRLDPQAAASFQERDDWVLAAIHSTVPAIRWAAIEKLDDAPADLAFAHWLRLLRQPQPKVWKRAAERLMQRLTADVLHHAPMLAECLPARVWQFVDAPEKLELAGKLVALALQAESLPHKQTKALQALQKDLELIAWYNAERTSRPAPEPIRDKKFK